MKCFHRYKRQNATEERIGNTPEEIFEQLKAVVHLIDFSSPSDSTGLSKLHNMLNLIYNGSYPIKKILADV